jgi:hypothetical protein
MWIARPLICRSKQSQFVEAECLDAKDRPDALCGLYRSAKGAIRCRRVVLGAANPPVTDEGRTHDSRKFPARLYLLRIGDPVGLNRTNMSALREQKS